MSSLDSSASSGAEQTRTGYPLVTALTYAMFFMFAMTTDAVGEIISIAKEEMNLSNTEASLFHWATMVGIALSGILLGSLADSIGRKKAIIVGLAVYAISCAAFFGFSSFAFYLGLLFAGGLAIGVFKTAILALIGDIAVSTHDHTRRMNACEGFFGIGAIIGPMIVVSLDKAGLSWRWLYLFAAAMCVVMIIASLRTTYPSVPRSKKPENEKTDTDLLSTIRLMGNRYAMGFSIAIALYVACEVSIFVWAPTLFADFTGTPLATAVAAYAVMIFFILRALGRFLAVWILQMFDWKLVMAAFTGVIFLCFLLSAVMGKATAVFLLPFSGLFMSMIYPTFNSKGISCLPKAKHGAAAGLILFFTAVSAAFAPLLMGYVSDTFGGGNMEIGFRLATIFAGLLFVFAIYNAIADPAGSTLAEADSQEY
ncbi:MAG: MFS transporter [Alphaproteobacteria bacterium]|nr:MFS transporter [Alphaproteobacteria bacterium]|tara:strand:- start:14268 stop:15542 length:1275 start_codon:yes stop_codon:yes gene_type:complete